jgi:hypothetical protein
MGDVTLPIERAREGDASALGVTDRTVRRDWEKARLPPAKALQGG